MRISLGILVACGLASGWLLARVVPDGLAEQCHRDVVTRPFELTRQVEVSEGNWFFLPQLWGDFELLLDLEVGPGAAVDILLRQVEPRYVDDVQVPFTGRFSTLRISSDGDGAGWRSREAALFGPVGGGVGVEPGRAATVWIEGRGKTLTANVGGKRQPAHAADDVYGMLAMVARGGNAVIKSLKIDARPIAGEWMWWRATWICSGGLAAVLVALVSRLLTRRRADAVAGVVMLATVWTLTRSVELPLMFPAIEGVVVVLTGAVVTGTLLAVLRGRAQWIMSAVCALGVLSSLGGAADRAVAGRVAALLGASDDAEVEHVFGPDSGEQPSKALGNLIRLPNGLVSQQKRGKRAFLLGGEWLYNRGQPGEHVGLQLGALLRGSYGAGADALSLPTVDGFSAQQWRLFDGFYQGFSPDVLVFGVGATEGAPRSDGGPLRTTASSLAATLRTVVEDCQARGRGLVLLLDVGAPQSLRDAARAAVGGAVPVVELTDELPRVDVARRLFAAMEPLLR
ncbi:MAG: hypothetical protein VXY92_07875 [Planctomycetota bacterium]|nr:hypothetical protein [Planctomycetota bacterium]